MNNMGYLPAAHPDEKSVAPIYVFTSAAIGPLRRRGAIIYAIYAGYTRATPCVPQPQFRE